MENDGSLGLRKTLEKGKIPDVAVDDQIIAVIYMNAFATAELRCIEDREEVTKLVDAYADKVKGLENIQFPHLTVMHDLAARLTLKYESSAAETNCNDYLASLPEFPVVRPFCFGGGTLFAENQVRGQKAPTERNKAAIEGFTALPQSFLVSFANLSCSTGAYG